MSTTIARFPSLLAAFLLALVLFPVATQAQNDRLVVTDSSKLRPDAQCGAAWEKAVICRVDLYLGKAGDRQTHLLERDTFRLTTSEEKDLWVVPVNQEGRRFPIDRFAATLGADRNCSQLLSIGEPSGGIYRLRAGNRTGTCTLAMRVANTLNLDRQVKIEVVAGQALGGPPPVAGQSGVLANWLYQGLLGRDAQSAELDAIDAMIARQGLDLAVRTMIANPEFQTHSRQLTAEQLLDQMYSGLLQRGPDPSGMDAFLPKLRQGDHATVILTILGSQEFQTRLATRSPQPR